MFSPGSKRFWWLAGGLAIIVVLFVVATFVLRPLRVAPLPTPGAALRGDAFAIQMTATSLSSLMLATPSPEMMALPETGGGGGSSSVSEVEMAQVERVILRDAMLSLVVEDAEATIAEIIVMTQEMGGWVVSSRTDQRRDSAGEPLIYGSISVRVPAERLDEALERIKADAIEVTSQNVSGQDVTQQYVDISSRLKNMEAAEVQLQGIMETARRVEDVLAVYSELVRLRGEIESLRGQIQYFDQASAFSLIQVNLAPETPGPVQAQASGWNPGATVENAFGTLIGLFQSVVDLGINLLVVIGIPLAIIGIPAWLIFRRRRRTISGGR